MRILLARLTDALQSLPPLAWTLVIFLLFLLRFSAHYALQPPFLMDFDLFYQIARRVLTGHAHELYAATGSAQALFKYGPVWALLIAPFGWPAPHAAAVLWSLLSVCALTVTAALCQQLGRAHHLPLPGLLVLLALGLLARPVTSEFLLGQTNILWALCTTAGIYGLTAQRSHLAAWMLALAISLKLPALLFVVYFLWQRQWRLAALTGLYAALLNIAAACFLIPDAPWTCFTQWLDVLRRSGPDRAFEIGSQSLLAAFGRLLRADGYRLNVLSLTNHAVYGITFITQTALFVWLFRRPPQTRSVLQDSARLVILMVLYSPTCWLATYSALLLPAMLAIGTLLVRLATPGTRALALLQSAALLLLGAMTHGSFWRQLGVRYFRGESYVYLVLMVLPLLGLAFLWVLASGAPLRSETTT